MKEVQNYLVLFLVEHELVKTSMSYEILQYPKGLIVNPDTIQLDLNNKNKYPAKYRWVLTSFSKITSEEAIDYKAMKEDISF